MSFLSSQEHKGMCEHSLFSLFLLHTCSETHTHTHIYTKTHMCSTPLHMFFPVCYTNILFLFLALFFLPLLSHTPTRTHHPVLCNTVWMRPPPWGQVIHIRFPLMYGITMERTHIVKDKRTSLHWLKYMQIDTCTHTDTHPTVCPSCQSLAVQLWEFRTVWRSEEGDFVLFLHPRPALSAGQVLKHTCSVAGICKVFGPNSVICKM